MRSSRIPPKVATLTLSFTLLIMMCVSLTGKDALFADSSGAKEFHLYAADLQQEMSQGVTLYSWGYGLWDPKKNAPASPPTVPGPEIRVTEGDKVKVVFHNQQKEPHTIHFHGIDNGFVSDGTPGLSQHGVAAGKEFTYEFTAPHAGTYFYHCHVEPDRHPEMGLYGAIIVEPKSGKLQVDGEFTLMLAERDPLLSLAEGSEAFQYAGTAAEHMHQEGGVYDTADRKARYFTINGLTDPDIPPMKVKQGGKYLIRLINAGSDVHTFHTHGHHFQVLASDGRDYPAQVVKDTITIGPGEKYDLLLTADNPGIWPVHCHIGPHSSHGMHMLMVYEGFESHTGGHDHVDPLGLTKHHVALLKQHVFEKNMEAAKTDAGEAGAAIHHFHNVLMLKNPEMMEKLEEAAEALRMSVGESADPAQAAEAIKRFDDLLLQVDSLLNGDLS